MLLFNSCLAVPRAGDSRVAILAPAAVPSALGAGGTCKAICRKHWESADCDR